MSALRIVFGIFCALVAVFAGGCSLIIFGIMINDWSSGSPDPFNNVEIVIGIAVIPAIVAAGLAWLCFRKDRSETS